MMGEKKMFRSLQLSPPLPFRSKLSIPLLLLLLSLLQEPRSWAALGAQEDIQCLRNVKESVGSDPLGYLGSWTVTDPDLDYCHLYGVECLHGVVTELVLANASLSGPFPNVKTCKSLNKLDLSNNNFYGSISPSLCTNDSQLVIINLAGNQFTGPIPDNLAACSFLNDIYLQNNDLCGPIPSNINNRTLSRLKQFEYYGNKLNTKCGDGDSNGGSPDSGGGGAGGSSKGSVGLIVGAVVGALAVGILLGFGALFWWFYAKRAGGFRRGTSGGRWSENDWALRIKAPRNIVVSMFDRGPAQPGPGPLAQVKLADLMAATDNFSHSHQIASTKSGSLYKGTMKDGSVWAIKRLNVTDQTNKDFRAEMETLGKLRHRNLVPLLGYCIAGNERFLIYEHFPRGSLQELLRDSNNDAANGESSRRQQKQQQQQVPAPPTISTVAEAGDLEKGLQHNSDRLEGGREEVGGERPPTTLDWQTRLKLAIGTARGLAWLHHSCNPRVLHRNICPSNILLSDELEPKISNFALARLMNPVDTHISTFVNGDYGDAGYVAPEYPRTLVATVRGDVFSLGVVMLELVTGQKATGVVTPKFTGNLAAWVWKLYNSGKVVDAIDVSLLDGIRDDEVMQFLKLAVSCVHPIPKERPSAYEVFHMLRLIGEKYSLTNEDDDIPLTASTTTSTTEAGDHLKDAAAPQLLGSKKKQQQQQLPP